jgi:hypothetical protein
MMAALRSVRGSVYAILQVTALAGGPGFNALEVYEHSTSDRPGHGRSVHLEAQGGQDHSDVCRTWRSAPSAQTPDVAPTSVRLPAPTRLVTGHPPRFFVTQTAHRFPPSRGPPLPSA